MHYRGWLAAIIVIVVILCVILYGLLSFSVSALPEPGRVETWMATGVKNLYIRRASRSVAPAPATLAAKPKIGGALFGMECSQCHGQNGRTPAPIGLAMYPRPVDLGSAAVGQLSDRELFWVIQHGIRLSGMPGFAHINSDAEIWQLVFFVRGLKH